MGSLTPKLGTAQKGSGALRVNASRAGGKVSRDAGPVKGGTTVIAFVDDPTGYKWEIIGREGPIREPIAQVMVCNTALPEALPPKNLLICRGSLQPCSIPGRSCCALQTWTRASSTTQNALAAGCFESEIAPSRNTHWPFWLMGQRKTTVSLS